MISNEINILRDTFRRLLRRKANTNLGKLIEKTHPADLALLFRFFNEMEQNTLFSIMLPGEHTGEFLGELDESIIKRLIENESAEHVAELIQFTTSNDKTSLCFEFDGDGPGILSESLTEFAARNINLVKIESRPNKRRLGRYVFLVDIDGHRDTPEVKQALESLHKKVSMLKIFGSYPKSDM